MIPLEALPGYRAWGPRLEALRAFAGPLWIHGEPGSGVSAFAAHVAHARGAALLDDADRQPPEAVRAWLDAHPAGVLGSHSDPETPTHHGLASACLAFRLPTFAEDPGSALPCLQAMALEEGAGAGPPALAALPCPGHRRGLRNRLLRWKLLGQLPEAPAGGLDGLALETEDLATNLHALERVLLHRALRRSYGNRVEAAGRLGVSRRQLYILIARHGDPVRGELPVDEGPKRLRKRRASQP